MLSYANWPSWIDMEALLMIVPETPDGQKHHLSLLPPLLRQSQRMWWTTHRVLPFLSRSNPGHVYLHFIGQMSHSVVLAFTCVVTYKATWVQKIISWRVPNRYLPPSVKTSPATYMTRPSASHLHCRITLLWPLLTGIQVDTESRIF